MLVSNDITKLRSQFLFADHLVLDESPTRDFYKELLRGLAHKNNNVLAVVQGFSSLILMNDLDDNTRENIEQMRSSSQHSSSLSERILTAGGCARISPQSLNLADFFPLMDGNLRSICEGHEVGFTLNVAEGLSPITADTSRLKEVLVELIKNGAEAAASESAGHVQLDVLASGVLSPESEERVDIVIRNNGPTIKEERLPEIYKPFYSTKGSEYFGIGLTTAGVLSGQMKMRLGIASGDGITTAWLSAPIEKG
tara:strand:+ start:694 stop:1455 length:762 start_codon:yes stop_codon:yes gene_type:complete